MRPAAKNLLRLAVLLLTAALAYLLLWPTKVAPVGWSAPTMPSLHEGVYAQNERLHGAERIAPGAGRGPEALSFDAQGRLYTGYIDGRVVRMSADGGAVQTLANTGGQPQAVVPLPDGALAVADAKKGLLAVDAQGAVRVLADSAEGLRFHFVNGVVADASGDNLYFTDSSWKFGPGHEIEDIIEHGANGRLLRYERRSGAVTVLMRGLYFANGLCMGPDDAYLLVPESGAYRMQRWWLKGGRAGRAEIFVDNLPGFPDNCSWNGRDRFWLALFAPRDALLDALAPRPFLRRMIARLPEFLRPKPVHHAFALGFDQDGRVVANLQDRAAEAYAPMTGAYEHDGWLYLSSIEEDAIGRVALKETR